MIIFGLYDKKANIYIPFLAPSIYDAQKALSFDVNMKANGGTPLSNSPQDFSLYRLGSVDDTGDVFRSVPPVFIEECFNLVIKPLDEDLAEQENLED